MIVNIISGSFEIPIDSKYLYIHICNQYIIVLNSVFKTVYSYEIINIIGGDIYIKHKHPLSIEKNIKYQKVKGYITENNEIHTPKMKIIIKNI